MNNKDVQDQLFQYFYAAIGVKVQRSMSVCKNLIRILEMERFTIGKYYLSCEKAEPSQSIPQQLNCSSYSVKLSGKQCVANLFMFRNHVFIPPPPKKKKKQQQQNNLPPKREEYSPLQIHIYILLSTVFHFSFIHLCAGVH